jgi:hypothetical protein
MSIRAGLLCNSSYCVNLWAVAVMNIRAGAYFIIDE